MISIELHFFVDLFCILLFGEIPVRCGDMTASLMSSSTIQNCVCDMARFRPFPLVLCTATGHPKAQSIRKAAKPLPPSFHCSAQVWLRSSVGRSMRKGDKCFIHLLFSIIATPLARLRPYIPGPPSTRPLRSQEIICKLLSGQFHGIPGLRIPQCH